MAFDSKQWFRDQIEEYLIIIKGQITSLSSVTGQHVTSTATTYLTLPTIDNEGGALSDGDITTLPVDDIGTGTSEAPQYPAGLYIRAGGIWGLLFAVPDIADILLNIGASNAEVIAGTLTDRYASVLQLKTYYAQLGGLATQSFLVLAGTENTDEAVNANQFTAIISAAEALADWTAA